MLRSILKVRIKLPHYDYAKRSNSNKSKDENEEFLAKLDLPDLSSCCGRGCSNCVWLQYADKIIEAYGKSDLGKKKALQFIEKLDDESLKSYLLFELKSRLK